MIVTCGGRTFDPNGVDGDGDVFVVTDVRGLWDPVVTLSVHPTHDLGDAISYGRAGGLAIAVVGYAYTPVRGQNKLRLRKKLAAAFNAYAADTEMVVTTDLQTITVMVRKSSQLRDDPIPGGHVLEFEVPLLAQNPVLVET